jgi:type II secretory pathway component PulM
MREPWNRLVTAFGNFSTRERLLVGSAGGLLGLAVLYLIVVVPILAVGSRASARLETAQTQYQVILRLREDFDGVQRLLRGVESRIQRSSQSNLRTTLETLAQKSQVSVESMEPQTAPTNDRYRETKVEVSLKGVSLPQTVAYLHEIESSAELLTVKSLRIRTRADKPELLDVVFTVSAFERI